MIQVDPLLAYGFASTLALAAHRPKPPAGASAETPAAPSDPFAWTAVWLGLTFAPQAAYLMARFPAWESMYVHPDGPSIPPLVAALVPVSIVGLGALGFWLTRRLLATGRRRLALGLMAAAFVSPVLLATVGWDGSGFRRLLYVGDPAAFSTTVEVSVSAFLTSELAMTLLWLEAILLVPYAVMLLRWRPARAVTPSAEPSVPVPEATP